MRASLPRLAGRMGLTTMTTKSGDKRLEARGRGSRKMKPMATYFLNFCESPYKNSN